MDQMGNLGCRAAGFQPFLDFGIDIDRAGARQRQRAANVIKENLGEPSITDRAEAFGHAPRPVGSRRPWQPERARHIRQELGIIHRLRGAGELQHEERRREGHDLVGRLVVIEIIVIVLHEKDRRRTEVGAVDRHDLRTGGALQHGLVVASQHDRRPVKRAGQRNRFGGLEDLAADGSQQVPVHLIAIGDDRIGLKAQASPQHPIAHGRRQEICGLRGRRRRCRSEGGICRAAHRDRGRSQAPTARTTGGPWRRRATACTGSAAAARSVKVPMFAARIAHAAVHRRAADAECRGLGQRRANDALISILVSLTVGNRWRTSPASHPSAGAGTDAACANRSAGTASDSAVAAELRRQLSDGRLTSMAGLSVRPGSPVK